MSVVTYTPAAPALRLDNGDAAELVRFEVGLDAYEADDVVAAAQGDELLRIEALRVKVQALHRRAYKR